MEDFLKGLYSALPSWARVLSDPIVTRLVGIYNWIFGLMRATIPNWSMIANGAKALRAGAGLLGFETFATLRWLIQIRLPQLANAARDAAIKAAAAALNKAVTPIVRDLLALRRWAQEQMADVIHAARLLREWALANFRAVAARLSKLEKHVFGVLSSPALLAAWIVAAMWTALWRYAWDNLDRLADAIWRRRQRILLSTVAEAERILGRLL